MVTETLIEVCRHFFDGESEFQLVESGHINKTYIASNKSSQAKIILQAINTRVFNNYNALLHNYDLVAPLCDALIPKVIDTTENQSFVETNGEIWRAFEYVESSRTILVVENEDQAYHGAFLFGSFLEKCSVIDPQILRDTIPDFHNLEKRIALFKIALEKDSRKRGSTIKSHLQLLDKHHHLGKQFNKATEVLPSRVAHNDTKPSNILFELKSDKALKVIDLDTVMQGLTITDFGDMIRSFTPAGSEDDPGVSAAEVREDIYRAVMEGFLESTASFLLPEERELLKLGAQCIVFEQALRFLTDYLQGDVYYKTTRENQNLDRAIHQLNILQSL